MQTQRLLQSSKLQAVSVIPDPTEVAHHGKRIAGLRIAANLNTETVDVDIGTARVGLTCTSIDPVTARRGVKHDIDRIQQIRIRGIEHLRRRAGKALEFAADEVTIGAVVVAVNASAISIGALEDGPTVVADVNAVVDAIV